MVKIIHLDKGQFRHKKSYLICKQFECVRNHSIFRSINPASN